MKYYKLQTFWLLLLVLKMNIIDNFKVYLIIRINLAFIISELWHKNTYTFCKSEFKIFYTSVCNFILKDKIRNLLVGKM